MQKKPPASKSFLIGSKTKESNGNTFYVLTTSYSDNTVSEDELKTCFTWWQMYRNEAAKFKSDKVVDPQTGEEIPF